MGMRRIRTLLILDVEVNACVTDEEMERMLPDWVAERLGCTPAIKLMDGGVGAVFRAVSVDTVPYAKLDNMEEGT
jgi:hypothetical protein